MEVSWFRCLSRSLPVLTLPDRRTPANRPTKFVFLYDIERILYGDTGHSTGAVHRLLQRESLSQTVVSLKRSSVSDHAPTALCTAVTDGRLGVRVVLHAGHYSRPPACARRTECLCHGHGRLGRCAEA